eukprot:scaffold60287_cov21-Tisochrysis_lutea.AAC.1
MLQHSPHPVNFYEECHWQNQLRGLTPVLALQRPWTPQTSHSLMPGSPLTASYQILPTLPHFLSRPDCFCCRHFPASAKLPA